MDLKAIIDHCGATVRVTGNPVGMLTGAATLEAATAEDLVWISDKKPNGVELLKACMAKVVVCGPAFPVSEFPDRCFLQADDPRLCFLRIVDRFFKPAVTYGVHPTAYIHPQATVHPETYIGPFTYIGIATIGAGTILYGHAHIYDQVHIGERVTIHAGTIIGADGFGYQRNEKGELEKFPHIGGVRIDDGVEIGANTCIDRGTLGDTWIREGARIDNLVHIAHNVIVGKHAAVIALAMIGGSTHIGEGAWVAPSAAVRDGIRLGNNSTTGMGAVVTKNIPDNETWTGSPARELSEFLALQKKFKG